MTTVHTSERLECARLLQPWDHMGNAQKNHSLLSVVRMVLCSGTTYLPPYMLQHTCIHYLYLNIHLPKCLHASSVLFLFLFCGQNYHNVLRVPTRFSADEKFPASFPSGETFSTNCPHNGCRSFRLILQNALVWLALVMVAKKGCAFLW